MARACDGEYDLERPSRLPREALPSTGATPAAAAAGAAPANERQVARRSASGMNEHGGDVSTVRSRPRMKFRMLFAVSAGALVLTFAPLFFGCDDEVVTPRVEPVLLGRVETQSGDPIVGARIGVIYHFPVSPGLSRAEPDPHDSSHSARRQQGEQHSRLHLINSPNPFTGVTTFSFPVQASGPAALTVCDQANVLIRTLVGRPLPAGYHRVVWDGRNDAGRRLPPGVYIARLELGEGPSTETHEIRMFLWTPDLQYFQDGYLTTSGNDGQFKLVLRDLPVGESVPFWSDQMDSLGSQPVLSTLDVCAVTDSEYVSVLVDVQDRQSSLSVRLRVGGTDGSAASRVPQSPGAPPLPGTTQQVRRAPCGRASNRSLASQ
jgi:hypothetical protein